jgi:trimeric autotransporter adhesin
VAAGTGPVMLSPTSLTFYDTTTPQTVTVSNYGTAPVALAAINLSSTNYTQTNNCGNSLSGQSVCFIYVSAATVGANFTGTMTLVDSDTTDAQTVGLTTNGAYSAEYDFGTGVVGYPGYSNLVDINGTAPVIGCCYTYGVKPGAPAAADYVADGALYGVSYASGYYPIDNGGPYPDPIQCGDDQPLPGQTSGMCELAVVFKPTAVGYRYSFATDINGVNYLFKGYGATATDSFQVSPVSVNFGNVAIGSSSNQSITVANTSVVEIFLTYYSGGQTVSPFSFTGGSQNNGEFSAVVGSGTNGTCSGYDYSTGGISAIPEAGARPLLPNCKVIVTFTRKTTGVRSTTLTITDQAGIQHSIYIQGGGTPMPPTAPASVAFGNVQVNTAGSTQTVTVTMPNKDVATAQISGTGFTVPGSITCAQGAATCSFAVTFAPTALGGATGTLTVTDLVTGLTAATALTGTGGVPVVGLSTNMLTFATEPVGTPTLAQTVTVTNNGNAPLVFTSVTIGGTNASSFALQSNTCTGTIAVNGMCSFMVTSTPQAQGPLGASVVIVSNAASSPDSVVLSGMGQAGTGGPELQLSVSMINFGRVAVGSSVTVPFTATNIGGSGVNFDYIAVNTSDKSFTQTNNCPVSPATLAPNAYCTINVTFAPYAQGPVGTGILISSYNAPFTGITISGTGQ